MLAMRNMENAELQKSPKWGSSQRGEKKTTEGDVSLSEICVPFVIITRELTRVEKEA